MGEVFRATKHGPDGFEVQVALKLILPHLAREEAFRRRFAREARLAASLKHPNIVLVSGFNIIEETPVIEMEYIKGMDLRTILRSLPPGEKLTLDESLAVVYGVARALAYAHGRDSKGHPGKSIIHCDLNPHNILISCLGEIKVTDFGIARAVHGDAAASATVRGKLAYMSPEQLEGRDIDRRSDLFSIGIVAYQLLTGKHPFERGSEGATITAIGKSEYPPLRETTQALPEALYVLIKQLLSVDPASRPQSAEEVVEVTEPLVPPAAANTLGARTRIHGSGRAAVSLPSHPLSPTASTRRRARWVYILKYLIPIAAAAVLIIAVLMLPAGITPDQHKIPEPVPDPPVLPAEQPLKQPVLQRIVTVQSEPPGARITADETLLGLTPIDITSSADGSFSNMQAVL
ncbi:MAG: serine/threonine-protein kinase, partial [Pseudomonadota bacterium]